MTVIFSMFDEYCNCKSDFRNALNQRKMSKEMVLLLICDHV